MLDRIRIFEIGEEHTFEIGHEKFNLVERRDFWLIEDSDNNSHFVVLARSEVDTRVLSYDKIRYKYRIIS